MDLNFWLGLIFYFNTNKIIDIPDLYSEYDTYLVAEENKTGRYKHVLFLLLFTIRRRTTKGRERYWKTCEK